MFQQNKKTLIQDNQDNQDNQDKHEVKITEGKNFLLVRFITNNYKLSSIIENKNICMNDLLDFRLINLMYQTNIDNFEKNYTNVLNENEAIVFLRMTHFFKEFGLKQRYICFDIKRHIDINLGAVVFILTQNDNYGVKLNNDSSAELLPITHMIYEFKLVNSHKMIMTQYIHFDDCVTIPAFLEPLFGSILKKMYKRTIKFIEKL
jgi:hypothetical protein